MNIMNKILIVFAGLLLAGCGGTKYTIKNESLTRIEVGGTVVDPSTGCVQVDEDDFPITYTRTVEGADNEEQEIVSPGNYKVTAVGVNPDTDATPDEDGNTSCSPAGAGDGDGAGAGAVAGDGVAGDGAGDGAGAVPDNEEDCKADQNKEWVTVNNQAPSCQDKCPTGQRDAATGNCLVTPTATAAGAGAPTPTPTTGPEFECSYTEGGTTSPNRPVRVHAKNKSEAVKEVEKKGPGRTDITCAPVSP